MYQIKEWCVGCHNCAMECPVQAIHYVGRQYQINPDVCTGCGHCAEVCHISAPFDPDQAVPISAHDLIEKDCDIVVCGGGTGLISAFKAAQEGKKVILLEKAKKLGGNSDLAHGFFAIYTRWHKEAGLEDLREQAIDHFMKASGNQLDRGVIRTAVYGMGECFDWLCDIIDMKSYFNFMPMESFGPSSAGSPLAFGNAMIRTKQRFFENLKCRDDAIGPGWSYTIIRHLLMDYQKEANLDLEILTETAAKHLITNDAGEICGVLAEDPGGQLKISAKAVILATGGFGRSDEKLQKYFQMMDSEVVPHRFSVPTDTGDGIDMLEELGVKPDPERMFTPDHGGPSHHPYSFALNMILNTPFCVQINRLGKRWRSEMAPFGPTPECQAFFEQPGPVMWSVYTKQMLDDLFQDATKSNPMWADFAWVLDYAWQDIEEEMAMPEDVFPGPACRMGETIADLAKELEIDEGVLCAEIDKYNHFCETGNDEDFHKPAQFLTPLKEGPFYAIFGMRFIEMAAGGLRVDEDCHVTDENGKPFKRLYGVGDATSAMHRRGEYAVISELTWAFASAYKSAENAVKEI